MMAYRRPYWNFALQRAVEWARELRKPLVVFEPLDCGYEWMSDRTHQFVMQGMANNASAFSGKSVLYYPYIAKKRGASRGLLAALTDEACVTVTDRFPAYIYPALIQAAARRVGVRLEVVDSCGLLPLDATDKVFQRAFSFRAFLKKNLAEHLKALPLEDPLKRVRLLRLRGLDDRVTRRWPAAMAVDVSLLDIDHSVSRVSTRGGWKAARRLLTAFVQSERQRGSGLSPYLHFGHISAHEVYRAAKSKPEFIDELVTWRELGFNMCAKRNDYDAYESLPDWAQRTLAKHAADRRPWVYTASQFAQAKTHDPLWNAAQRQLVIEGRIEPYLRMLWGKKILEWSPTPQRALSIMLELNNKYALDGRDPNSYNGIMWVLGRYDRPWGPERPIFGTVRYMSSQNTARKMPVKDYIEKYAG
jgi:deoxyribodipyrimidine photo-lyase